MGDQAVATTWKTSDVTLIPSLRALEWEEAQCILVDENDAAFVKTALEDFDGHDQRRGSPPASVKTQATPVNSARIAEADESTAIVQKDTSIGKGWTKFPADLRAKDSDIVIALVGPTGVGKSTFINTALGDDMAAVGHNLAAQTTQLQDFILCHPKDRAHRIVLLDTPGFNDIPDNTDDRDTFRRINDWLTRRYGAKMKLSGIIYLLEITQARFNVTPHKNMDLMHKLCGDLAPKNVILATTKWGNIPEDRGERREEQLKSIWRPLLDKQSRLCRFHDTRESAMHIINMIVAHADKTNALRPSNFLDEVDKIDKILAQTEAGRALPYTLRELVEARMAAMPDIGGGIEQLEPGDDTIHALINQIRSLNVQLARHVKYFFGL
ncbi:hypothetical protein LshimejAT787_0702230 [Lyophyllum shimeji]|uniref:G domain-containing protein n=1 Tax=Lyophyllum shimeji TaxID=47721 RepID=A0A9P3UNI6_LYOSH|nr:hypothetical protein LshimejAT787_0702230 [Lyophyllum shimeji]